MLCAAVSLTVLCSGSLPCAGLRVPYLHCFESLGRAGTDRCHRHHMSHMLAEAVFPPFFQIGTRQATLWSPSCTACCCHHQHFYCLLTFAVVPPFSKQVRARGPCGGLAAQRAVATINTSVACLRSLLFSRLFQQVCARRPCGVLAAQRAVPGRSHPPAAPASQAAAPQQLRAVLCGARHPVQLPQGLRSLPAAGKICRLAFPASSLMRRCVVC